MKLHYGILAALLMSASGMAQAEQATSLPAAEKTSTTNAATTSAAEATEMETEQQAASATEAQAATPEAAQEEQSGFSKGSVVRSVFTTEVEQREPVDNITELTNESKTIYYYTELRDMAGQTAKHRWEYNGEVMAEVEFNVGGPRWRVWSSKNFVPQWTGDWKVSVLNGANEIISEDTFHYTMDAGVEPEETGASETATEAPAAAE